MLLSSGATLPSCCLLGAVKGSPSPRCPGGWRLPGSQGLDLGLLICKEEAEVDLPAVVTVCPFAELALYFAITASSALLLRSVRPPAWEMGFMSREKCGHRGRVSASHCPGARRALQGWPRLTQG